MNTSELSLKSNDVRVGMWNLHRREEGERQFVGCFRRNILSDYSSRFSPIVFYIHAAITPRVPKDLSLINSTVQSRCFSWFSLEIFLVARAIKRANICGRSFNVNTCCLSMQSTPPPPPPPFIQEIFNSYTSKLLWLVEMFYWRSHKILCCTCY